MAIPVVTQALVGFVGSRRPWLGLEDAVGCAGPLCTIVQGMQAALAAQCVCRVGHVYIIGLMTKGLVVGHIRPDERGCHDWKAHSLGAVLVGNAVLEAHLIKRYNI